MKQLSAYILENFKISHKTKTQAYHAIQPKNGDGICLYISVAHHKKHIECGTIKYSYNKNNPETIQCEYIGVIGGILVKKQDDARNGEIVVALIGDEATVKTFYKEKNHIRLQPENSTMDPIILDKVYIVGKAIGLYRQI